MQVQIGPVSSASVTAWVTYARAVLDQEAAVGADVVAAFERYLTDWSTQAASGETFLWTADLDVEEVEFLAHTWFTLADSRAATSADPGTTRPDALADPRPTRPAEGDEFFQSLVTAMLDGLSREGRSWREFAEQLREDWPGLRER